MTKQLEERARSALQRIEALLDLQAEGTQVEMLLVLRRGHHEGREPLEETRILR